MAWTKEVHHSRLQAKRETAAKQRDGEPVSYGRNSGLAPAALVACVLLKIVPGEACGPCCHGILVETAHAHDLLPAAWLRNRHRFERKGIRASLIMSSPCVAPRTAFLRLSMHQFYCRGCLLLMSSQRHPS